MNRRGQVFESPVPGESVVVLADPDDHPDRALVGHLTVAPGGHVAIAHRHPSLRERFHVLSGEVGFLIGEEEHVLGAGEEAEVPPDTMRDWWQIGAEPAQIVAEVDPGDRFVEIVGTIFGLARDGKVDGKGTPRPLQRAATAGHYTDVMVVASPPPTVQRAMFALLGPIGRLRGRQPGCEEYLTSAVVVEPDPAALAMLDDGRLRCGQPTRPLSGPRETSACDPASAGPNDAGMQGRRIAALPGRPRTPRRAASAAGPGRGFRRAS